MLRKTIPAAFAVVLLSSCGSSDVPPWLLDNGNPGDAGKDALSDVIHNDTTPDSTTDVPRDIREVWQDMVVDTGSDIRDTIGDDGAAVDDGRNDAVDAQSDPGYTDAVNDVSDAVDARDAGDARDADVTIDIDIDIGWECGRDDDCVPPADLGTCEKMTCTGHVCVRGDKPDLETCNDGSVCTSNDRCMAGVCGGTQIDCNDGNVCTTDYCIPSTGCATTAKNNIACDDLDPCTVSDRCAAKVCAGTGMTCTTPPSDKCNDTATGVVSWFGPGTCQNGECTYPSTTAACPDGCANAECIIDPCSGVVCNTPPGQCREAIGECTEGTCLYDFDNSRPCTDGNACTVDTCRNGVCNSVAMVCNTPPAKKCSQDGQTMTVWASAGQCQGGECVYTESTIVCTGGCVNDVCISDPCVGVDCTTAPGQCLKSPGRCVDGECEFDPDDTATCSDDDACTEGDFCQDGQCQSGTGVDCDDGDMCTLDYCDVGLGCEYQDVSGACDDNNACTDNTCSPLFGCEYPWNSDPCSDGDECTVDDICDGGFCTAGAPADCDDGNICTTDSCDETEGCRNDANNALCRAASCDGLVFSPPAYCSASACQYPAAINCDDGEDCTADSCNATSGCSQTFVSGSCDDDNVCTSGDKCQGGLCNGTPVQCLNPPTDYCSDQNTMVRYDSPGTCVTSGCQYTTTNHVCQYGCNNGTCNGDPCEGVSCNTRPDECHAASGTCEGGVCTYAGLTGNACDTDNSVCTVESCETGACVLISEVACDDGDVCTDDECNPATGCVHQDNTADCDDNDACTTDDRCSGGNCGGTAMNCDTPPGDYCDDATAVHLDAGTCVQGACDWATTRETCQWGCLGGVCNPDPCEGVVCNTRPNQCRAAVGRCEGGSCVYDPLTGTDCDLDSSVCTADKCANGVCNAGFTIDCDEGNPCEDYGCDAVTGCTVQFNMDVCDDNNACTENDFCLLGTCAPGDDRDCGDTNVCTDNGCDPATGCTVNANTADCDDGNLCTAGDTCSGGSCGGLPYTCDNLACATRSCDGLGGCDMAIEPGWCVINWACHMEGTGNPDNQCETCQPGISTSGWTRRTGTCDDGDECTIDDVCTDGVCAGTGTLDCNDNNACTTDSCLAATGCNHEDRTGSCDDGDVCTGPDTCTDGTCAGAPVDCGETTTCIRQWCEPGVGCRYEYLDGTCDDGDPCTVGDQCSFGNCATLGLKNCDDHKPCTTDSCVGGVCQHANVANLTDCDDGNPCTTGDKCYNGNCGGSGLDCNDENDCTTDSCDVDAWECTYTANANPCDDGNPCTADDTCSNEACSGTSVVCNDNNVCTDDSCDPASGCKYTPNSQACDDGNHCTENDVCGGGTCGAGPVVDCDDGNECTGDSCNPLTGCVNTALSQSCDDGDDCSYNDYCFNKACVGTSITCEPALACTTAACNGTDTCDQGIQDGWCVIDGTCVAGGSVMAGNDCLHCDPAADRTGWSANDGVECDDSNDCTVSDTCLEGACDGTLYSCDDGLACTADACTGGLGCDNVPADGWCAIDNTCVPDGATATDNVCLICDPYFDNAGWSPNSAACDDNDECTVDDQCMTGACQSGSARNCNDGNVCTQDLCESDRTGGCHHPAAVAICAGPRCEGLTYWAPAMCSGTTCPAQVSHNCDDGNQCTDDSCTESGCVNTARTGTCDDGNNCTYNDTCGGTACAGTAYVCAISGDCIATSTCDGDGTCTETPKADGLACTSDGNPCTDDVCGSGGTCLHTAVTNGTTCNDNNLCTTGDSCLNGACSDGGGVVCAPLDSCHVAGVCDPGTGVCSNPVAPDNTSCDDGNACTSGDVCTAGACAGPVTNQCAPLDTCHDYGSCNPTTGECTYPTLADGTTCNDDNLCTTRDVCSKGTCRGLDPISCAPTDGCHYTGTCEPSTGICAMPYKPDGTMCDDSNACTSGTTCSSGSCTGGTAKTCTAINNCHFDGVCNPSTGVCSTPIKDNGTVCTDNNACTKLDQCVSGTCTGTTYTCSDGKSCTNDTCLGDGTCAYPVSSGWCLISSYCRADGQVNSTNACQVCDYDTSTTQWTPNTGASCNDYLSNTMNDVCVSTTCTGTPYDCGDGLDCTEDICDGSGGATHYLISGYCNIDGACQTNGSVNPANPCQKCVTSSSTTAWTSVDDGLSCDDSQQCTFNDKCQSGSCQGTSYSCDDGLDCTNNWCDGQGTCGGSLQSGYCLIWNACVLDQGINPINNCQMCSAAVSLTAWSPANQGEVCDDNNAGTTNDRCVDGQCIGEGESCVDGLDCTDDIAGAGGCENPVISGWCLIDGVCSYDGDVNTANRCQMCDADVSQSAWVANDGIACSDNDECTQNDVCENQVCTGTAIVCDDHIACTVDSCNYGTCQATVSDGWCLISGNCVAAETVNTSNSCEICDPDRLRVNWSSNDGQGCDDSDICTFDDSCVSRVCRGTSYGCDDGIACTADSCDGAGGCDHNVNDGWCLIDGNCITEGETSVWNVCRVCDHDSADRDWSANTGATCDDDDLCTSPDTCSGDVCTGQPEPCDDGLECTTEACDGQGGCEPPVLAAGWCLINGQCVTNRGVNPDNACLICKPELATDAWSFRNGVTCDDGSNCTMFDTCESGVCGGAAYQCDQHPACVIEACDGAGGCLETGIQAGSCRIDSTCFDDGSTSPSNQCRGCVAATSQTAWTDLTGTSCSDGNICSISDTCVGGVCSGELHSCDDGIGCTDNVCDGAGDCEYPVSSDWCQIDGVCYEGGMPHPTAYCMVCAPTISQTQWTHQDGNADEVCNGIDDNCDGVTDPEGVIGCEYYYLDTDHDGRGSGTTYRCLCAAEGNWSALQSADCDDTNPAMFPGNTEACDTWDNDCDGATDEQDATGCTNYSYDYDGDGWGQDGTARCLCATTDHYTALVDGDCNDASVEVNPGATETCNGSDDNCDGVTDPDNTGGCTVRYPDEDSDGWGGTAAICMCSPRGVYTLTSGGDCVDNDDTVNPDGTEICNLIDDNCDGTTDNADVTQVCPLDAGWDVNGTRSCQLGRCTLTCQTALYDPPQNAWYDIDDNFKTGCECEGDSWEISGGSDCTSAVDLGSIPDDGSTVTVEGNLPGNGVEDWFRVTVTDPTWNTEPGGADRFHAKIVMDEGSTSEFEIAVTEGSCSGTSLCGSGETFDWAVDFTSSTLGENPCALIGSYCPDGNPEDYQTCVAVTGDASKCNSCPALPSSDYHLCADNTKVLLIRVSRHDGSPQSCNSYKMTISNGI